VVRARRIHLVDPELLESLPVAQCHTGVDERRLHRLMQRRLLFLREFRTQIRDHRVIAGQHAVAGANVERLSVTNVGYGYLTRTRRIADIHRPDDSAVEPQPDRRIRPIETAVIDSRRNDIFRGVSRNRTAHETPDQQARDSRVAVREVQRLRTARGRVTGGRIAHLRNGSPRQLHPLKSGELERPDIQGRHRIDANSPFAMRTGLEKIDDRGVRFHDIAQKIAVTDFREPVLFLVG
jgi:hypothetical protein